jgi:DeoR family suf operon transcriptional repressor
LTSNEAACYTLSAMTSPTREVIVRTLKAQGKCTVNDLAEAAAVSPVSVRHHITALQAQDLVVAEEVKHGVGRPYHVFSLTEKAFELYPGRYFKLTNRLLDEIKDHVSEDLVTELFSGVANAMAIKYASQLQGLPLEERLPRLMEMLGEEGFDAEYEWRGDEVIIREFGCPYVQIGRKHPEVCAVDTRFIATALDLPAERVNCLLDGDTHCTFTLKVLEPTEELLA